MMESTFELTAVYGMWQCDMATRQSKFITKDSAVICYVR